MFVAFLAFLLLARVACEDDFYRTLGVRRDASTAEIKKAYKKLAKIYHPDLSKDKSEAAKQKFIKVSRAFEVLSDEKKREIYDRGGEEGVRHSEQGGGANFGGHSQEDIINMFFGGANFGFQGNGGGFRFQQRERNGGRQNRAPKPIDLSNESNVIMLDDTTAVDFARLRENWNVYLFDSRAEANASTQWFANFAAKYGEHLKTAAADCSRARKLCAELGPKRVPELQIRNSRGRTVRMQIIENLSKEFVVQQNIEMMENAIVNVSASNYVEFVMSAVGIPILLIFTERRTPSLMMLCIANRLKGSVLVGEVRGDFAARFGIYDFPAVALLQTAATYSVQRLEGEPTRQRILAFIADKALSAGRWSAVRNPTRLTREVLGFGACGPNDATFCLIAVCDGDSAKYVEKLAAIGARYSKDPLSLFYIHANDVNLTVWKERFAVARVLIVRGKRGRLFALSDDLLKSAESSLIRAIDGLLAGNTQKMVPFASIEELVKRI